MERAPVLETERLILRAHCEKDLPECHAMWSDPMVVKYIGGRMLSREDAWARLLRYAGHWYLKGFGYWVIEDRQSGRFAGEIGFADFKRDITPTIEGSPEMGWVLPRWAHGKGYGTEAVAHGVKWAQTNIESDRMVCLIHPENAPSIRLAVKSGFEELELVEYRGTPTLLFERR